jgi:Tfp pilus assembly protein PilV
MWYRQPSRRRGTTHLEVMVSLVVLLFGATGAIALFPVGVRLNRTATDDVLSAMTAQNALAAVLTEPGLRDRVRTYVAAGEAGENANGDVLGWATDAAKRGVEGLAGTVVAVGSSTSLQMTFDNATGRTLAVKDADGDNHFCGLMLMANGPAANKLYRLGEGSSISGGQLVSGVAETRFDTDRIAENGAFRIIGARDRAGQFATVPADFYNHANGSIPPFHPGRGAAEGYGYLAVVTRLEGQDDTFRVDILVYKGYDSGLPPEGNLPAVACYTTIVSGDMLN